MNDAALFTSATAQVAWGRGELESWIHAFLAGEGDNLPLSQGLRLVPRQYSRPLSLPLSLFERCVGPGAEYRYQVDAAGFERRVAAIQDRLATGWDMPPLIVHFVEGRFELTDGNHRHEALLRSGRARHDVIIWTTAEAEVREWQSVVEGLVGAAPGTGRGE